MFYTSVDVVNNKIAFRGIKDGKPFNKVVNYEPTLFVPCKGESDWHSYPHGLNVAPMSFASISEAKDFLYEYRKTPNLDIYGDIGFEYQFIAEFFPGDHIEWNFNDLDIACIDIEAGELDENGHSRGFPNVDLANQPITAITVYRRGTYMVYGCGDYVNNADDVVYKKCDSESDLLQKFLADWSDPYPHAITGWFIEGFDMPYLYNRIKRLFGEKEARKLSPWRKIRQKTIGKNRNNAIQSYDFVGIATLDYQVIYRQFAPQGKSVPDYKLNTIAQIELKRGKLDYSEFGNLFELFAYNYQKFIEYNIEDVRLIIDLDARLSILALAYTLAYDTKCNISDVFKQTRMWDSIIHYHLKQKKLAIPPRKDYPKKDQYMGAYVQDAEPSVYNWIMSFDVTSLYPSLMVQYNIGPETIVEPSDYPAEILKLISEHDITIDSLLHKRIPTEVLKKYNLALTPNGQFFRRDKQSIFGEIIEKIFSDRKKYQAKLKEVEREYERTHDSSLLNDKAKYNNLQLVKKINMNSLYGAAGNEFFRYFDVRQAEGVTSSGQLAIQWVSNEINRLVQRTLKTNKDYVIYKDTDSAFLNLEDLVNEVLPNGSSTEIVEFLSSAGDTIFAKAIDKAFIELNEYTNGYKRWLYMKREKIADKGLWSSKKRYALRVVDKEGIRYSEPQIMITGLEAIRLTVSVHAREKLKEAIHIIFDSPESEMWKFVSEIEKEWRNKPLERITLRKGCSDLETYADNETLYKKGCPQHVKGALIYNKKLKDLKLTNKYPMVKSGDKVQIIKLRLPNAIQSEVVAYSGDFPVEFGIQDAIDYERLFQEGFVEPLQFMLNAKGWSPRRINRLPI